jgi:hypothetical protein
MLDPFLTQSVRLIVMLSQLPVMQLPVMQLGTVTGSSWSLGACMAARVKKKF